MTIHFIGAGPGAADLITVRGRELMARCPVCLYAGSLVPAELLAYCPPGARIVNTAPMSLDDIVREMQVAHAQGLDVARLHSGDLSIWSALGEQLRRLDALGIAYTITPGVPSFAAAAAALGAELTLPGLCQSVVLTRTSGRATAMPEGERLAAFAATGAVLALHLSIHAVQQVQAELLPHYGADCPAAIVWRASWPDETVVRTTVGGLARAVASHMERTALILVGRTLGAGDFADSRLYADDYDRRYRPRGTHPRFAHSASELARAAPALDGIAAGMPGSIRDDVSCSPSAWPGLLACHADAASAPLAEPLVAEAIAAPAIAAAAMGPAAAPMSGAVSAAVESAAPSPVSAVSLTP